MAASLLDQLAQKIKDWRVSAMVAGQFSVEGEGQPDSLIASGRARAFETCAEQLEALCRSWQAEQGWRTIESAPKDEAVLVFCPPNSRCVARRGVYRYGFGGSWVSIPGSYSIKPTHWQPLPPFVASSTGTQE